jgi:hypothetical protein
MPGIVSADTAGQYFRMTSQSTERSDSVPGRRWYAVPVLVFLAGMTVFAVFLFARVSKLGDDFVRVTTPGQAELSLDPGGYTIFHEQGGMTDGTGAGVITAGDIAGLRISVQNPETGTAVPLTASAGSRYTFDGRSGQSLFTFTLTEPGTYRLVARYDDGRPGPQAVLAITRGFMRNLLTTVFGGLAIAFGSFAIAGAIGISAYRRRRRVLGRPILPEVSIWRMLLTLHLDLFTASLLGVFITALSTGLLTKSGFSLPVWPSLLMLAIMVGYFVLSHRLFGGTLWQHILKAHRRPGMET